MNHAISPLASSLPAVYGAKSYLRRFQGSPLLSLERCFLFATNRPLDPNPQCGGAVQQ